MYITSYAEVLHALGMSSSRYAYMWSHSTGISIPPHLTEVKRYHTLSLSHIYNVLHEQPLRIAQYVERERLDLLRGIIRS